MEVLLETNIVCPKCGNMNYMRRIEGATGTLKYKCINCYTYFTESELFGSESNSAKSTSKNISTIGAPPQQIEVVIKPTELTDECINKIAAAIARELKKETNKL